MELSEKSREAMHRSATNPEHAFPAARKPSAQTEEPSQRVRRHQAVAELNRYSRTRCHVGGSWEAAKYNSSIKLEN